jgi:hypothetical protein
VYVHCCYWVDTNPCRQCCYQADSHNTRVSQFKATTKQADSRSAYKGVWVLLGLEVVLVFLPVGTGKNTRFQIPYPQFCYRADSHNTGLEFRTRTAYRAFPLISLSQYSFHRMWTLSIYTATIELIKFDAVSVVIRWIVSFARIKDHKPASGFSPAYKGYPLLSLLSQYSFHRM